MRGIERVEICEGRGCKGVERLRVINHPQSLKSFYMRVRTCMRVYVHARMSIYFRIRTVARVILAQYEAEVVYCLLRTFKVT